MLVHPFWHLLDVGIGIDKESFVDAFNQQQPLLLSSSRTLHGITIVMGVRKKEVAHKVDQRRNRKPSFHNDDNSHCSNHVYLDPPGMWNVLQKLSC